MKLGPRVSISQRFSYNPGIHSCLFVLLYQVNTEVFVAAFSYIDLKQNKQTNKTEALRQEFWRFTIVALILGTQKNFRNQLMRKDRGNRTEFLCVGLYSVFNRRPSLFSCCELKGFQIITKLQNYILKVKSKILTPNFWFFG